MSEQPESMTDRLSRFTPSAVGLDRDAILFAAGRQSVRGRRVWPIVATLFAMSNVVTLVVLWPASQHVVEQSSIVVPSPNLDLPPASTPPSILTAGSRTDVVNADSTATSVEFAPIGPTLTAGSIRQFD